MKILLILILFFCVPAFPETLMESFDKIWDTGKKNIYPPKKSKLFTHKKYKELKKKVEKAKSVGELGIILNPFLDTLHMSHTQLYTEYTLDYYFFQSLFTFRDPEEPKINHIGAQYLPSAKGTLVKAVLQGYPAEESGLRRGDIILKANGKKFDTFYSFTDASTTTLDVKRGNKKIKIKVTPVYDSIPRAFLKATENSARIIEHKNKKIGYVQLWFGGFDSHKILQKIVEEKFIDKVDALILDLRDGFGAAWWDHLDPFYPNREQYFVATSITVAGKKSEVKSDPKTNSPYFAKPMVVLINEGVRSGKEAVAYQFKKTKRAKLIGTTTAGAFVVGTGNFSDEKNGYIFYLSSMGLLLDKKVDLEGKGVKPDIKVDYPITKSFEKDPQLQRALKEIVLL